MQILNQLTKISTMFSAGHSKDINPRLTDLTNAARRGRTIEATHILSEHPSFLNATNRQGQTALICASAGGHLDTVDALLALNPDINARKRKNRTALITAAKRGHRSIVQHLLAKNPDIEIKDSRGYSAVDYARRNRSIYADIEKKQFSNLIRAVYDNNPRTIRNILSNNDSLLALKTGGGESALDLAERLNQDLAIKEINHQLHLYCERHPIKTEEEKILEVLHFSAAMNNLRQHQQVMASLNVPPYNIYN